MVLFVYLCLIINIQTKDSMRKICFPVLLMLLIVVTASAQSKKEMQETINELNQSIGELKAVNQMLERQLKESQETISLLRQENEKLKGQLVSAATAKPAMTYRDSIAEVLSNYFAAETWEDRSNFVMEPERVRPLMAKYYKVNPYTSSTPSNIKSWKIQRVQGKNHRIYIVDNDLYVVKSAEGYKIDWEANVEYNPTPILEMKKINGQEYVIRGYVGDQQKYYSNNHFMCYNIGAEIDAYTRKDSPVGKTLLELLPIDGHGRMTVKLKYDKALDSFLITELMSSNCSLY